MLKNLGHWLEILGGKNHCILSYHQHKKTHLLHRSLTELLKTCAAGTGRGTWHDLKGPDFKVSSSSLSVEYSTALLVDSNKGTWHVCQLEIFQSPFALVLSQSRVDS